MIFLFVIYGKLATEPESMEEIWLSTYERIH